MDDSGFGYVVKVGMLSSFEILAAASILVAFLALLRLCSLTVREIAIPFANGEPPRGEVKAALERMGCLVTQDRGGPVTGLLPGVDGSWGQEVTVTIETGRLRVRSCFSRDQLFGARRNQENVERFRAEWERRAEFRVVALDSTVRAFSEAQAREVARKAVWPGALAVATGLGLLSIVLFVPSREGASPGSKLYVGGIALTLVVYGLPRVRAAVARLKK